MTGKILTNGENRSIMMEEKEMILGTVSVLDDTKQQLTNQGNSRVGKHVVHSLSTSTDDRIILEHDCKLLHSYYYEIIYGPSLSLCTNVVMYSLSFLYSIRYGFEPLYIRLFIIYHLALYPLQSIVLQVFHRLYKNRVLVDQWPETSITTKGMHHTMIQIRNQPKLNGGEVYIPYHEMDHIDLRKTVTKFVVLRVEVKLKQPSSYTNNPQNDIGRLIMKGDPTFREYFGKNKNHDVIDIYGLMDPHHSQRTIFDNMSQHPSKQPV
jgi:hypothetical protein